MIRKKLCSQRQFLIFLKTLILLFLFPAFAQAMEIDKIVVFGDSLSDDGNFALLNPETFPPDSPYYEGRFSNGPVWAENLATLLHFKREAHQEYYDCALKAQFADCAYGGAMVAPGVPISISTQVTNYISQTTQDKQAAKHLFVLWGGAIDYLMGIEDLNEATNKTIAALYDNFQLLVNAGAKNIMLPNLPDIGLSPAARNNGPEYAKKLSNVTRLHNKKLAMLLENIHRTYPDLNVFTFDVFGLVEGIIKHPAKYHIKNTQDACFTEVGVCSNPDDYLFYDHLHPTKQVHKLVADIVFDMIKKM